MKHEDVVKRLRTDPEFGEQLMAYEEAANDASDMHGNYTLSTARCAVLHEELLGEYKQVYELARELAEMLDEATNELIEDLASYGVSYQELPRGKRKCDLLDKARAAGLLEGK